MNRTLSTTLLIDLFLVNTTQLGVIAGYQWLFNNKFSLEPALELTLTAVGSGTDSILGAGVVPLLFAVRVSYIIKQRDGLANQVC